MDGNKREQSKKLVVLFAIDEVKNGNNASDFSQFKQKFYDFADARKYLDDTMFSVRAGEVKKNLEFVEREMATIKTGLKSKNGNLEGVQKAINDAAYYWEEAMNSFESFMDKCGNNPVVKNDEVVKKMGGLGKINKFPGVDEFLQKVNTYEQQKNPQIQNEDPHVIQPEVVQPVPDPQPVVNDNNNNIINEQNPQIQPAANNVPPVQPVVNEANNANNNNANNNNGDFAQQVQAAKANLNARITTLKNQLSEEIKNGLNFKGIVDKTSEVMTLQYVYESDRFWNEATPERLNNVNNNLVNGVYGQNYQNQIANSKFRVESLYNKLGLRKDAMLPDSIWKYGMHESDYKTINDAKVVEIRKDVLKYDPKIVNLYAEKPKEGFTDELKNAIALDLKYVPNLDSSQARDSLTHYFNPDRNPAKAQLIDEINTLQERTYFLKGRPVTTASTFMLYLMGRPENAYSYEEARKIVPGHQDFEKEVENFRAFLKENVTRDEEVREMINGKNTLVRTIPVDPAKKAQGAANWAEVFKKCAKTMSEYRFPDIDYTNPDEVNQHTEEFADLSQFVIDYQQNIGPFLSSTKPEYLDNLPGGRNAIQKAADCMNQLQGFCSNFGETFRFEKIANELNANHKDSVEKYLRKVACNRALFGLMANEMYRGKKLGDASVLNGTNLINRQIANLSAIRASMDKTITKEMSLGYLKNNDPAFVQKMIQVRDSEKDNFRKVSMTNEQYTRISEVETVLNAQIKSGLRPHLNTFFGSGKTGEELYAQINTPAGKACVDAGSKVFYRLFEAQNQTEMLQITGIDPLSMIRINGKTIEETWGEKYAFLDQTVPKGDMTDEQHREKIRVEKKKMYQAELVNEMIRGNAEITFDHYALTKENNFVKIGTIPMSESIRGMEETRKFLKNVKDLHTEAENASAALLLANVRTKPAASEIYNEMGSALQRLTDHSKISTDNNCAYPVLKADIQAFLNNADAYYTQMETILRNENAAPAQLNALAEDKKAVTGKIRGLFTKLEEYAANHKVGPVEHEQQLNECIYYTFGKIKTRLIDKSEIRLGTKIDIDNPITVFDGDNAWLNEPLNEDMHLTPEQYAQIDSRIKIKAGAEYMGDRNNSGNLIKADKRFSRNLIIEDPVRVHSLFVLWAMGEKNLDLEDAAHLADKPILGPGGGVLNEEQMTLNANLRNEFLDFIVKNPMKKPANTTQQKEDERVTAWMNVFAKAKTQIENYRMPDIAYDDINQMGRHFKPLMEMRGMAVDAVQEWEDRLLGSTTYEHAAKCAGSEQKFNEVRKFYLNLQTSMTLMTGYEENSDNPTIGAIANVVERRYYANKVMKPYRGKTFGEFLEGQKVTLANEDKFRSEVNTEFNSNVPVNLSLGYALGLNVEAYEVAVNNFYTKTRIKTNREIETFNQSAVNEYRSDIVTPQMQKAVLEAGDDLESMRALWKTPITDDPSSATVGDRINRNLNSDLCKGFLGEAVLLKGLKKSDLFVIDGQTPEQKWGAKYAEVQDADEKEYLYRLEIIKAIVRGESTVEIRSFVLNDQNEVVEGEKYTAFLSEAKMQQMADYAGTYLGERDNLLSELKDIRTQLITTHPDDKKKANFFTTDITGSTSYQNMCTALKNAIDILQKEADGEFVEPGEIRSKLEVLQNTSDAYYESHKGRLWGPVTGEGQLRLKMSDRTKSGLVDRFNYFRSHFDTKLMAKTSTCKDAPIRNVLNTLRHIKKSVNINVDEDQYYKNTVIKRELDIKLRGLKGGLSVLNMENDKPEMKAAKQYLIGFFEKLNAAPAKGVGSIKQDPENLRMIEHFDEKAKELAANPVFQKLWAKNPEDCINRWQSIEKKEREIYTEYTAKWNALTNDYADYAHNTLGITNADKANGVTVEGKLRSIAEDPEGGDLLTAFYDKAAENILILMLAENEEAMNYRLEIAENPARKDEILEAITNYLKNNEVLSGNNISTFATKMNDEKFKKNFLKNFKTEEKRKLEAENVSAKLLRENNANVLEFLYRDYDGKNLTLLQYTAANETLKLTKISELEDSLNLAGNCLTNPIRFTRGEEQIDITPDVNVYKKCQFGDNRMSSTVTPLVFYAVSEKGMSLDDAFNLALTIKKINPDNNVITNADEFIRAQQLRYDFYKFCEAHPVTDETKTQQELTDNFKAWAKIYKNGTDKLLEAKLPEINYRNENEVYNNLREIGKYSRLLIDGDQEFERLYKTNINGVSGLSTFKSELGGENAFNERKATLFAFSAKLMNFEQGYTVTRGLNQNECVGRSVDTFRRKILTTATMRCLGQQEMNSYVGKTILEIAKTDPAKSLYQKDLSTAVKGAVTAIFDEKGEYYKGVSPEDALNYMLGIDKETFEKGLKPIVAQCEKDAIREFNEKQIDSATSYRHSFKLDDVTDKLVAIPDDNGPAMVQFLNSPIDPQVQNSPTGLVWLNNKIADTGNGLFNTERAEVCKALGINLSDTVRIGGKSPEELWGAKYPDVTDTEIREQIYRLEILKAIAKGNQDITVRNWKIENDKLIEAAPANIFPKRETMKELCDAVHVYEAGKAVLQHELNDIKAVLVNTQRNPLANFADNEAPEGNTQEYKNMTAGLKQLLGNLNDDANGEKNITVQNILDSFDYAIESAKEYECTHQGNKVGNAKIRVDASKKLQAILPMMKESYLRMRKGFDSTLSTSRMGQFKDAPYHYIKDSVRNMETGFRVEKENEKTYQDRFLAEETIGRLDYIKENSPIPEDPEAKAKVKLVRDYMDYAYRTKAEEGLITEDMMVHFRDDYQNKAKNLVDNHAFLEAMRKDGAAKVYRKWDETERIAEQLRQDSATNISTQLSTFHSLTGIISGNPLPFGRFESTDAYNKSCAEHIKRQTGANLDNIYTKLAKLLAIQMMGKDNSEAGKTLRSFIAYRGGESTELGRQQSDINIANIKAILEAYEVLKPGNVDRALDQLESGRLAEDMEREFLRNFKWNEMQREKNIINDNNLIHNIPGEENDLLNANVGQPERLRTRDNNLDDSEDEIDINLGEDINTNIHKPNNAANQDAQYDMLYENAKDNTIHNENEIDVPDDIEELENIHENGFKISKNQFKNYMKGVKTSLDSLSAIDKNGMPNDPEQKQQMINEKGKLFAHAVTARKVYADGLKFRPNDTLKKLEIRAMLGEQPENLAKKSALNYLLEHKTGAELTHIAKTGSFDKELADAEKALNPNQGIQHNNNNNIINNPVK